MSQQCIGAADTNLITIRGNSASGKSSVARTVRERYGYGLAWVSQDLLRRTVLRERDAVGAHNVGLIDLTVRYALDHGFHVVLDGILHPPRYAEMIMGLARDHRGRTTVTTSTSIWPSPYAGTRPSLRSPRTGRSSSGRGSWSATSSTGWMSGWSGRSRRWTRRCSRSWTRPAC